MVASKALLQWLASGTRGLALDFNDADCSLKVDGAVVKQPNTVARTLAKGIDPTLVGGSSLLPEQSPILEAQVIQWQTWASSQDPFSEVVKLNDHLLNRSYLVGTGVTLADIQVYWALAPAVQLSFPGPLSGLVNLSRWYNQVQHTLRLLFPAHDPALLPSLVSFTSLYKPLSMPVLNRKRAHADGRPGSPEPAAAAAKAEKLGEPANAGDGPSANGQAKKEVKAKDNKAAKTGGDAADGAAASGGGGDSGGAKKEKKEKDAKPKKEAAAAKTEGQPTDAGDSDENPNHLDIRVGKIVKAWKHPEAEKLYCEEIDCGEEGGPRQIASGLRHFYADESELVGRHVLVLANLKPRALVGFKSHGMVLCASNDAHDQVKFVEVPASAKVGDRIIFPKYPTSEALSPAQVAKKKVFEKLAPGLATDEKGVANYKGVPFTVESSGETCTAPLVNAHVS